MRIFLMLLGVSFLSMGNPHAQEPNSIGEFLIQTALDSKHCSYTLEQSPIDKDDWDEPDDKESILEKIARGDRLMSLDVNFQQKLTGNTWLPISFQLETSYWVGKFRIGFTFRERYRLKDLNCTLRATSATR